MTKAAVQKNHPAKIVFLQANRKDQPFVKNDQKIILIREKEKESGITISHLIKEMTEELQENSNHLDQHREAIHHDRMEKNVMRKNL